MKAITWSFEPGHTAAEFRARHMMVTWVRGQYKNVSGTMIFDPDDFSKTKIDVTIDATSFSTGQPQRDEHLRSSDFLDVAHHPKIEYHGKAIKILGATSFQAIGDLTIRGATQPVALDVTYLGQWVTPWWEDGVDRGPRLRAGFEACARINRQVFGVSWNEVIDRGGVVVSDEIEITLDVEAVNDERVGAAGSSEAR
jgi:polyisoprenoid-binding protein YceI